MLEPEDVVTELEDGSILVTDCTLALSRYKLLHETHSTRLEVDTKVVLELFRLPPLQLGRVIDESLGHLGPVGQRDAYMSAIRLTCRTERTSPRR